MKSHLPQPARCHGVPVHGASRPKSTTPLDGGKIKGKAPATLQAFATLQRLATAPHITVRNHEDD